MANKIGREALRGVETPVLDLIAEVLTSKQWADLLKAPLEHAAFLGDRGLAQKLIEAGAEIGDALQYAVGGGHRDVVNDLLENGAPVATKDSKGNTPLHGAAKQGKPELVQALLLEGADIDTVNNEGSTPLLTAVCLDNVAAALTLLAAGADVRARCGTGFTRSVVHIAAGRSHVDILRTAIEHGADVNDGDRNGNTPLHLAAVNDNTGAIDVLVEAGGNVAAMALGCTPLHHATDTLNNPEAVTALLRHGTDVNARDNISEETPLHNSSRLAGCDGTAELVDFLLRSGADETIAGDEGTAASVVSFAIEEEDRLAED